MKIKYLIPLLLGLYSTIAWSGSFLAKDVTITKVSSTSNKADAFWVHYEPADAVCSGKVKFQKSKSGTEGTFNRSFTLATTALVTGKRVEIYTYESATDCLSPASINLLK